MTEFTLLACQHLETVIDAGEIENQAIVSAIRQIIRALKQSEAEIYELKLVVKEARAE